MNNNNNVPKFEDTIGECILIPQENSFYKRGLDQLIKLKSVSDINRYKDFDFSKYPKFSELPEPLKMAFEADGKNPLDNLYAWMSGEQMYKVILPMVIENIEDEIIILRWTTTVFTLKGLRDHLDSLKNKEIEFSEKIINPNEIDTTGRKICPGDLVLVFNGDGGPSQDKKWSYEKIHENFETKELYSVFGKYLRDIETKVKNIKPEWIVIIKQNESLIFHHDNFGFKG